MSKFETRNGWLCIGEHEMWRVAEIAGRTPFYAIDRRLVCDRLAELRRILREDVEVSYSMKAKPLPALVHHLASRVDGLDVASGGELALALSIGIAAERISFAGPGKSEDEIRRAVAAGVTLVAESEAQVEEACRAGDRLGLKPRLMIRVNPDFVPGRSGMRMGGGDGPPASTATAWRRRMSTEWSSRAIATLENRPARH